MTLGEYYDTIDTWESNGHHYWFKLYTEELDESSAAFYGYKYDSNDGCTMALCLRDEDFAAGGKSLIVRPLRPAITPKILMETLDAFAYDARLDHYHMMDWYL